MANHHTEQKGTTDRERVLAYVRTHPDCMVEQIAPVLGLPKGRVAQYLVRLKYAKLAFSTHIKGDTRLRWNAPQQHSHPVQESFRKRVLDYVTAHPGCYGADIVRDTGLDSSTVSQSLYALRKRELVTREPGSSTNACRWILVDVEMPTAQDRPICKVTSEWSPHHVRDELVAFFFGPARSAA